MKSRIWIPILIVVAGALLLAAAIFVPNSLPSHSDFSAIYNTDLALVHGIPIYDIPAVEALAQKASGLPPEKFFLPRFPYPPWYALSTFYLGLLPAPAAATLWFELNLLMLFLSVWFLTDGWPPRVRLFAFPASLFFLPVLGGLSIGQYDFPVLLGASMLLYSLRRESLPLTVLGAVLLTFKPHIGALVLAALLIHLAFRRDAFGRHALRSILVAGVFLFLVGFIADPAWPVSYPGMLLSYQGEGNVATCSECASLPVWISRWFLDGSLSAAALVAVVLLILFALVLLMARRTLLNSPSLLLTFALLATILVVPYLYNYDYMMLLVIFAFLIQADRGVLSRLILAVSFLVPTIALVLMGRDGNISLLMVTLAAGLLLFRIVRAPAIDVPARAA